MINFCFTKNLKNGTNTNIAYDKILTKTYMIVPGRLRYYVRTGKLRLR
jgi:hypothetical protein